MSLDTHAVPAAPARSADRGVPLSPAQQAALLPERLARTAAANVFVALEISSGLADGVVERAAALLGDNEILRTIYPDDRRVPYQRVEAAPAVAVEVLELDAAALPVALMTDAGHRFDLVRELPIRMRLYRLADHAVLSVAAHPVAADDRTLDLLVSELFEDSAGEPAAQYRDFAAVQMKLLAAEDDSLAYWKQRLAGLPEQTLPMRERPRTPRSARAEVRIPAATLAALPFEPDAVLTALIADALRELGAVADVPIGIAAPARPDGAERVLGNFANYLVLRVDSPRADAPARLIADTARLLDEAREHAGTRIERLTHQLRGPGGAAKGGLFQVLASVRPAVLGLDLPGGSVREIARAAARPHGVDLIVDAITGEDGWILTVDLAEELSRRYSAQDFSLALLETIESWSAAPDSALGTDVPVRPCGWFEADDDDLALDPLAISGLGGPPQTPNEQAVADALREILELDEDDEVGRKDNFFALGGDSVAALRFVTVLAEHGHILDVQQVFEFPTVHEMAANIGGADAAATPAEPVAEVAPLAASGLDAGALAALAGKLAGR
ncbi:condensation domain-containing protein [Nocardia jejuensis]|uniref:condensation domain-containing protein n=1 Tax=Nocardia jejuensis TaxID=328049 RepID=UPI000834CE96|nr:condensation domain-containing protein [Nocardia jejuensis]